MEAAALRIAKQHILIFADKAVVVVVPEEHGKRIAFFGKRFQFAGVFRRCRGRFQQEIAVALLQKALVNVVIFAVMLAEALGVGLLGFRHFF